MLTDDQIYEALDYFTSWMGFALTVEQFRDIIKDYPELENDINEYGADTGEREEFMSAFARRVVGRDWPTYGEGQDVHNQFMKDLVVKGLAAGYTLTE